MRHAFDEFLLAFEFRVEDAQRIRLDAPLAVRPELVFHFGKLRSKQFRVFRAALLVPDAVDIELNAFQPQSIEKRHHHFNQFGIDAGSIASAQYFRVDLVELAVAPLLRPLTPKHRAEGVQLHRLRQLLHVVFDVGATDRCGGFGTETYELYFLFDRRLECLLEILRINAKASLQCILHQTFNHVSGVSERKHFFRDHIRVEANRTGEELRRLEDWQTNFAEAVGGEDFLRNLFNAIPESGLWRQ